MKRFIVILLSVTIIGFWCFADSYDDGLAAFKAGDYTKAKQLFVKASNGSVTMKKRLDEQKERCDECIRFQEKARECKRSGDMTTAYKNYLELLKINKDDKEANNFLQNYTPDKANTGNKSNMGGTTSASTTTSSGQPDYSFPVQPKLPANVEYFYMHDGTKVLCYINPERPEMTYHEAVAYCNKLNLEGETGWRLPTMDEMLRFYGDYPDEKGKLVWVGYKGVIINDKTVEENEANSNMKYCPCVDGSQLVVHPFRVNSQNRVVAGQLMRHHFFPVKTK